MELEQLELQAQKFRQYMAGKTVAIVGPSPSIRGCGLGGRIEACDVVVRVNRCLPIMEQERPDVGKRRCAHVGDNPLLYEIPTIEATDVDYPADVPEAERRLKELYRLEPNNG